MKKKFALTGLTLAGLLMGGCKVSTRDTKEIESHRAKDLIIALSSEKGDLTQGQNHFVVAFRSASTNQPVDVGRLSVNSTMAMPGMAPMSGGIELQPAGETGKYLATGDFEMSGSWHFEVHWDGPAGQGSTSFNSNVR